MCYNPFWIYEQMLEQEYLERMASAERQFVKSLKTKTDAELEHLLWDAEEMYDSRMREKVMEEQNRRYIYE